MSQSQSGFSSPLIKETSLGNLSAEEALFQEIRSCLNLLRASHKWEDVLQLGRYWILLLFPRGSSLIMGGRHDVMRNDSSIVPFYPAVSTVASVCPEDCDFLPFYSGGAESYEDLDFFFMERLDSLCCFDPDDRSLCLCALIDASLSLAYRDSAIYYMKLYSEVVQLLPAGKSKSHYVSSSVEGRSFVKTYPDSTQWLGGFEMKAESILGTKTDTDFLVPINPVHGVDVWNLWLKCYFNQASLAGMTSSLLSAKLEQLEDLWNCYVKFAASELLELKLESFLLMGCNDGDFRQAYLWVEGIFFMALVAEKLQRIPFLNYAYAVIYVFCLKLRARASRVNRAPPEWWESQSLPFIYESSSSSQGVKRGNFSFSNAGKFCGFNFSERERIFFKFFADTGMGNHASDLAIIIVVAEHNLRKQQIFDCFAGNVLGHVVGTEFLSFPFLLNPFLTTTKAAAVMNLRDLFSNYFFSSQGTCKNSVLSVTSGSFFDCGTSLLPKYSKFEFFLLALRQQFPQTFMDSFLNKLRKNISENASAYIFGLNSNFGGTSKELTPHSYFENFNLQSFSNNWSTCHRSLSQEKSIYGYNTSEATSQEGSRNHPNSFFRRRSYEFILCNNFLKGIGSISQFFWIFEFDGLAYSHLHKRQLAEFIRSRDHHWHCSYIAAPKNRYSRKKSYYFVHYSKFARNVFAAHVKRKKRLESPALYEYNKRFSWSIFKSSKISFPSKTFLPSSSCTGFMHLDSLLLASNYLAITYFQYSFDTVELYSRWSDRVSVKANLPLDNPMSVVAVCKGLFYTVQKIKHGAKLCTDNFNKLFEKFPEGSEVPTTWSPFFSNLILMIENSITVGFSTIFSEKKLGVFFQRLALLQLFSGNIRKSVALFEQFFSKQSSELEVGIEIFQPYKGGTFDYVQEDMMQTRSSAGLEPYYYDKSLSEGFSNFFLIHAYLKAGVDFLYRRYTLAPVCFKFLSELLTRFHIGDRAKEVEVFEAFGVPNVVIQNFEGRDFFTVGDELHDFLLYILSAINRHDGGRANRKNNCILDDASKLSLYRWVLQLGRLLLVLGVCLLLQAFHIYSEILLEDPKLPLPHKALGLDDKSSRAVSQESSLLQRYKTLIQSATKYLEEAVFFDYLDYKRWFYLAVAAYSDHDINRCAKACKKALLLHRGCSPAWILYAFSVSTRYPAVYQYDAEYGVSRHLDSGADAFVSSSGDTDHSNEHKFSNAMLSTRKMLRRPEHSFLEYFKSSGKFREGFPSNGGYAAKSFFPFLPTPKFNSMSSTRGEALNSRFISANLSRTFQILENAMRECPNELSVFCTFALLCARTSVYFCDLLPFESPMSNLNPSLWSFGNCFLDGESYSSFSSYKNKLLPQGYADVWNSSVSHNAEYTKVPCGIWNSQFGLKDEQLMQTANSKRNFFSIYEHAVSQCNEFECGKLPCVLPLLEELVRLLYLNKDYRPTDCRATSTTFMHHLSASCLPFNGKSQLNRKCPLHSMYKLKSKGCSQHNSCMPNIFLLEEETSCWIVLAEMLCQLSDFKTASHCVSISREYILLYNDMKKILLEQDEEHFSPHSLVTSDPRSIGSYGRRFLRNLNAEFDYVSSYIEVCATGFSRFQAPLDFFHHPSSVERENRLNFIYFCLSRVRIVSKKYPFLRKPRILEARVLYLGEKYDTAFSLVKPLVEFHTEDCDMQVELKCLQVYADCLNYFGFVKQASAAYDRAWQVYLHSPILRYDLIPWIEL